MKTSLLSIFLFFHIPFFAQNDSLEVERLYALGLENLRVKPKISQAHFENAVKIINAGLLSRDEKNKYFLLKKALMLDDLSYYYRKEKDYVLSLKSIEESLNIKEGISETYSLPTTYRMYGRLYQYENKDSVKAKQFYEKAMVLAKRYENNEEVVNVSIAYSSFYLIHKKMEKVKEYAQSAYHYSDSIGFDRGKTSALFYFSAYERHKKKYGEAIRYSKEGLEISRSGNDKIAMERNFKDLGYAHRKSKQPEKAIYYYKKSLELLEDLDLKSLMANRCLSLSNAYTDVGEHELAFAFYRGTSDSK